MANRQELDSEKPLTDLATAIEALQKAEDRAKALLLTAIAMYVPNAGAQYALFAASDAYAKASHRRRIAERELEP